MSDAAAQQARVHTSALPFLQDLRSADFPLPTLGPKLEQFRKNAVWGLGFQLLRRESSCRRAGGEAGGFICPGRRRDIPEPLNLSRTTRHCMFAALQHYPPRVASFNFVQQPPAPPSNPIFTPSQPPTTPPPVQASLWTS